MCLRTCQTDFWRVRKHETQSYRESCVFHFSHFELYFALHSCVLSTFQQHLLQFPTIIYIIKNLLFILITYLVDIVLILSGEILSWSLMGVKGLAIRHCWAVVLNSMNINQFQLTGFCWFFLDLESLLRNVWDIYCLII